MSDPPASLDDPNTREPQIAAAISRYWRRNVALMAALLVVWAAAGLGAGVLLADRLNAFRLGGFPLGFWFAQQGSILVFVVLVLAYALAMKKLDRDHHADLESIANRSSDAGAERP